jgi:hypothetical protein
MTAVSCATARWRSSLGRRFDCRQTIDVLTHILAKQRFAESAAA